MSEKPEYLLVKHDLYFLPDSGGYTSVKQNAGRYYEIDAMPQHGVEAVHHSRAPQTLKRNVINLKTEALIFEAADMLGALAAVEHKRGQA